MGLPPTGEIVARVMVRRACGCEQEFQHYKVDRYRAQRLAKFQGSRCPACVAKLEEEQRQNALPPKGEALKALPVGTHVTLTLQADGTWAGVLTAGTIKVEGVGPAGAGAQAVVVSLARQWLVVSEGKAPPAAPAKAPAATAPSAKPAVKAPAPAKPELKKPIR